MPSVSLSTSDMCPPTPRSPHTSNLISEARFSILYPSSNSLRTCGQTNRNEKTPNEIRLRHSMSTVNVSIVSFTEFQYPSVDCISTNQPPRRASRSNKSEQWLWAVDGPNRY
ncbi:hypothetical protein VFPPC_16380 [Pochonia chlamydosporia 170]|uniref:Uncharacterized protein n=1 Tax=Pochonia chlamydosporia 170 TaxID=1380566 RepID=A0A179FCE6_METCM|nr:hypothetical protein VFPPC_16380 [Pochonia chlamydosporia 170]OAQ62779.1 hypothetical protein VFPPC_16380 [Pochonia chlamydosporia 170]